MTRQNTDHPIMPPPRPTSQEGRLAVRAEKESNQPPPDTGVPRRQLSPTTGKRHQLAFSRSTGHHRQHLGSPRSVKCHLQSSPGRDAHASYMNLAYEAAPAHRLSGVKDADVGFTTISSRRRPLAREAFLVLKRAQQSLTLSAASAAAGATAPPCFRRVRRVSHLSDHCPGTTPFLRAPSSAWRLHRA